VGNQTGLRSSNIVAAPEANICNGYPTQGAFSFDNRYELKQDHQLLVLVMVA